MACNSDPQGLPPLHVTNVEGAPLYVARPIHFWRKTDTRPAVTRNAFRFRDRDIWKWRIAKKFSKGGTVLQCHAKRGPVSKWPNGEI